MTEKQLKRLNRRDLIDIIDRLQAMNEENQKKIAALQGELNARNCRLEKAGSIAEASLALSDIFNRAQDAADLYLEKIKGANQQTEKIIREAEKKASAMVVAAKKECDAMRAKTSRETAEEKARFHAIIQQLLEKQLKIAASASKGKEE